MIGNQWRPSNLCSRLRCHIRICLLIREEAQKGANHVNEKEELTKIKLTHFKMSEFEM